nr:hypothetical protein [Hyphomonas sp. Mor2]
MVRVPRLILVSLAAASFGLSASAAPIIRDAALFETFAVEGVSLDMAPEDAFNHLKAAGYSTGSISVYSDWGAGALNFERGSYGGPNGLSSITLGRAHGRLALISQSLNKPGIDVQAEINTAQSHFAVTGDEPDCRMNSAGTSGSCAARDADVPDDVTMKYTMTVLSTMIMRSISRPKDLKETLN